MGKDEEGGRSPCKEVAERGVIPLLPLLDVIHLKYRIDN